MNLDYMLASVILALSLLSIALFFLLYITLYRTTQSRGPILDVPLYGNDTDPDTLKKRSEGDVIRLLRAGHAKYPDQIFQIRTKKGNRLVIPPRYLDELDMKSDDTLQATSHELFEPKNTKFGRPDRTNRLPHAIQFGLNGHMAEVFPVMQEEVDYSMLIEFPQYLDDWTPIKVYDMLSRLVFRVSASTFIGPGLAHNDEWITLNLKYSTVAFEAAQELREFPPWTRPIVKYFIPEVWKLWRYHKTATKIMTPMLKERNCAKQQPKYGKPADVLEWVRDQLSDREKKDYEYHALTQLAIGTSSLYPTTSLLCNVLYDLAAYSSYLNELREEVQEVLKRHDGKWTMQSMFELKKMDSFIKESQRFHPDIVSFRRKAIQSITLSDGTQIPEGAYLFVPAEAISRDPAVYEMAHMFDGMRFYNLRQQEGNENNYQLTSISNTQLHFEAGRRACPGRWFASHEMKMIVAALITVYDFKSVIVGGRPMNVQQGTQNAPDAGAQILLKSRS